MEQLRDENVTLRQQLTLMAAQLAQLQSQMAAAPPPPPVLPPPPRRSCPVAVPDKFAGNVEMFPAFFGQCQLFMSLRAEDFPQDRDKVGFIISLLSGSAARWATPLLVQNSPLLNDFQGFCEHLQLMYEDPIKAQTSSRRLKALKQGRLSLQEYISEFRLCSQDSAWNEAALMDAFLEGLSDALQDELARVDLPSTLNELCRLCLRIDARLQHRPTRRAPPEPRVAPGVSEAPAPREEPMEIGAARPRLSRAEKDRRRAGGLCLYCGEPGHFAASCTKKRRSPPAPGPVPQPTLNLSGNGQSPI